MIAITQKPEPYKLSVHQILSTIGSILKTLEQTGITREYNNDRSPKEIDIEERLSGLIKGVFKESPEDTVEVYLLGRENVTLIHIEDKDRVVLAGEFLSRKLHPDYVRAVITGIRLKQKIKELEETDE